jgi:small subunit ribosomal protein S27Ae
MSKKEAKEAEPKKQAARKTEEKKPEETAPKEKPVEEAKPKVEKQEKEAKPEKKKKEEKGVFTLYKIEQEKCVRLRPTCERCGTGYFMADHGNRFTCGHCGFTRYKPTENGHV